MIRDGSMIGPGAAIADSVLLDGCRIGVRASVRGSILAPEVEIGDRATVADGAVIGRGADRAGVELPADARVQPDEVVDAGVTAA